MSYCCYLYLTCLDYMSNISDCLIRERNCLPFAIACVHSRFLLGSVLLIFLVFCAVLILFALFVLVMVLVYPILPVSIDCPYLSIFDRSLCLFSNIYLHHVWIMIGKNSCLFILVQIRVIKAILLCSVCVLLFYVIYN